MSKSKYLVLEYIPKEDNEDYITAVIHFAEDMVEVRHWICEVANEHELDLNDDDDLADLYGMVDAYNISDNLNLSDFITPDIVKTCDDCDEEYPLESSVCPRCGDHNHHYEV